MNEFTKLINDEIAKVKEKAKNDADKSERLSHYMAGHYKYQFAIKILNSLKKKAEEESK